MTVQAFNQLSHKQQQTFTYVRGRYLATRWQGGGEAVRLYLIPEGFFVESVFDTQRREVLCSCAFAAGGEVNWMEDYIPFIKLPDWMPAAE